MVSEKKHTNLARGKGKRNPLKNLTRKRTWISEERSK
jgi:hypothetical protein